MLLLNAFKEWSTLVILDIAYAGRNSLSDSVILSGKVSAHGASW